jgi:hypothetical protein
MLCTELECVYGLLKANALRVYEMLANHVKDLTDVGRTPRG